MSQLPYRTEPAFVSPDGASFSNEHAMLVHCAAKIVGMNAGTAVIANAAALLPLLERAIALNARRS